MAQASVTSEGPEGSGSGSGTAEEESVGELIPGGFRTVDEFSKEGFKRIIEATKAFQALPPPGPLWDLQKSYPEFSRAMKNSRTRILPILRTLLEHSKIQTRDFKRRDLEEKFDFIVESNDDILERIGSSLDDAAGLFKRAEMVVVNQGAVPGKPPGTWGKKDVGAPMNDSIDSTALDKRSLGPQSANSKRPIKKAVHRIRVLEKPQLKFKIPVDNSSRPFVPKLTYKPNSLKPLSILPEYNAQNEEFYGHPYQVELTRWEPKNSLLTKVTVTEPLPVSETPLILVEHKEQLDELMKDLREASEIAVDLEHHSQHTFLGLTCLIQISTRSKDYIIDVLSLRDDLECLNEVFTHPNVVKVLHGSNSDIEWLQRDFGVYIVGLFDTFLAAKYLGLTQLSLQALLSHFCSIILDKAYQLADWRIRPLPDGMISYARLDTHYLLKLYDLMKNELIDKGNEYQNLLRAVFDQSKTLCLYRYEKPGGNPMLALRKTRRHLNNRQLYAFTELYKWRDQLAREKDESRHYILPSHMLLTIAESLPKEMTGILACCDPVPEFLRSYLGDIHKIVVKARDLPFHQEKIRGNLPERRKKVKNWVLLMNSLYDVDMNELNTHSEDLEDKDWGGESGSIIEPVTKEVDEQGAVKSWPIPFKNIDYGPVSLKPFPSLPLGRALAQNFVGVSQGKDGFKSGRMTAFERYQITSEILEKLKDPKQKEGIDHKDHLVKVVVDTIYNDSTADQGGDLEESESVPELSKTLPDSEFIPFNPMAQSQGAWAQWKPPKPKKSKPLWDDSAPLPVEPNNVKKEEIILIDSDEDDEDDKSREVGVKNHKHDQGGSPTKRQKKKKGKNKFLNKLKNFVTGRSEGRGRERPAENDQPQGGSTSRGHGESRGGWTRGGGGGGHSGRGSSPRGGRGNRGGGGRDSSSGWGRGGESQRGDRGGSGRGNEGRRGSPRGKWGGNIFDAFRRKDGKSVTYKK